VPEGSSQSVVNEAERRRWNDERWTTYWPRREALTGAATSSLMMALGLQPGERVLDVGTGGGSSTIEAARRVGPKGTVLGIDLSEALAALARDRAKEAGADNVSFVVSDAQTSHFPGAPFDVAMSQFGVMFFEEPTAAFANIGAHLRRGARLAFACWQAAQANPWNSGSVLRPFVAAPQHPVNARTPPGPFSLGDPAETESILADAGFADVEHRDVATKIRAPASAVYDPDQLEFLGVTADQLSQARAALAEHLAQFPISDGAYELPVAYSIWSARTRSERSPA
jgi:SAM-dependent methyltransferase